MDENFYDVTILDEDEINIRINEIVEDLINNSKDLINNSTDHSQNSDAYLNRHSEPGFEKKPQNPQPQNPQPQNPQPQNPQPQNPQPQKPKKGKFGGGTLDMLPRDILYDIVRKTVIIKSGPKTAYDLSCQLSSLLLVSRDTRDSILELFGKQNTTQVPWSSQAILDACRNTKEFQFQLRQQLFLHIISTITLERRRLFTLKRKEVRCYMHDPVVNEVFVTIITNINNAWIYMGEAGDGSRPFLINFDQQYLAFVESDEKLNLSSVNENAFALLAPRNMKDEIVLEDPKTHYLNKLKELWSTFGTAHIELLLLYAPINSESDEINQEDIYKTLFYAHTHGDRLPEIHATPAMSVMLRDMTGLARLYGAMVYNMGDFVGHEYPCLAQLSYVGQVDLAEICFYGFSYNLVDDLSPKNSYKTLQIVYMKTYARSAMQKHHEHLRLSKVHVKNLVKNFIKEAEQVKGEKTAVIAKRRFALEIAHSNNARIKDLEMQISSTLKKFKKMFEFLPSELQIILGNTDVHTAYKKHATEYRGAYKFVKDMGALDAREPEIGQIPAKVTDWTTPAEILLIFRKNKEEKQLDLKRLTSYLDNAISEDVLKLRKSIFGLDSIHEYIANVMSLYRGACKYRSSKDTNPDYPDILLDVFDMFQHTNAVLQDTVTTLDTIKYMYTKTHDDIATILGILKDGLPLTNENVTVAFENIATRASNVLKDLQPYEIIHNRVVESELLKEQIRRLEEEWTELDQEKEKDVVAALLLQPGGKVFIKSDKVLRNDALKVQKTLYMCGRRLFVKYRRTYISVHDYQTIKKSQQWNVVTRS
jgi:hypothetical protein